MSQDSEKVIKPSRINTKKLSNNQYSNENIKFED